MLNINTFEYTCLDDSKWYLTPLDIFLTLLITILVRDASFVENIIYIITFCWRFKLRAVLFEKCITIIVAQ